MPDTLHVLCVHGVGHGDVDTALEPSWKQAITAALKRCNATLDVAFDFLKYDDLFDHAPLNVKTYAVAVGRMLASGVIHGIGDMFAGTRGLFDVPDTLRWTAGMIAQWATEDDLRNRLRQRILDQLKNNDYGLITAHSLGSLATYDTFRRNPDAIANRKYLTLGSQIGNAFVRDCFAGRIEPLDPTSKWYHLYNHEDHVFTAEIRLNTDNFAEVRTPFDKTDDLLNHDPIFYFNHTNTQARVWPEIAGCQGAPRVARVFRNVQRIGKRPQRRALLIGINEYPDPENRLEGCVNDVFLMSAILQERGFEASEIRTVLDARATTGNIMERLHWLLDDVPDDAQAERVLFYSGHGAQIPSYDWAGEVDHLDECLVPYDFDWSPQHAIRDKQFLELYSQLPYNSRFIAVFDCCHSGGLTREGGLRPRGLQPPDDIRHRMLRWNRKLGMWEERNLQPQNQSLSQSKQGEAYVGQAGATNRLGRAVPLRGLPNRSYDRERLGLDHRGPYLPVIFEACRENQLSYEYRDGANSYGAFTFSLAKALREDEGRGRHPTFEKLSELTAQRLKALKYEQDPCLVGPKQVIRQRIPWRSGR
jgi:hypothetical protein